jgi:hypothetical protein
MPLSMTDHKKFQIKWSSLPSLDRTCIMLNIWLSSIEAEYWKTSLKIEMVLTCSRHFVQEMQICVLEVCGKSNNKDKIWLFLVFVIHNTFSREYLSQFHLVHMSKFCFIQITEQITFAIKCLQVWNDSRCTPVYMISKLMTSFSMHKG